jgi:hypothetical protein
MQNWPRRSEPTRIRFTTAHCRGCDFFQYHSSGITRLWTALLAQWALSGFLDRVLFLERKKQRAANPRASLPSSRHTTIREQVRAG